MAACDVSTIIAAAAFRTKYRIADKEGKVVKVYVRPGSAGVDRGNRGNMYPAGIACKRLCAEILTVGVLKEEATHACVAVEEPPWPELLRNPDWHSKLTDCPTSINHNTVMCAKDDLLKTCFEHPYDRVDYTFLSHNHLMLVMRAFITGAKWDTPFDAKLNLTCCDSDGRLSLAAVAGHRHAKEMFETIDEGFPCETLSWKMIFEESNAASTISQALNSPASVTMRTTELTALSVLRGEIIKQSGLSQNVAYMTVLDKVRVQLETAADDADLPELFDFLISNGVNSNTYIDDLLQWAGRFVDGKLRQLRFAAWIVINKMCPQAVWTKMAVLKRAYRANPKNAYCPSPEAAWAEYKWEQLKFLEELLRFFHVSCAQQLSKMESFQTLLLLGNIDIAASEEFIKVCSKKTHGNTVAKALLDETKRFMVQLGLDINEKNIGSCRELPTGSCSRSTKIQPQPKANPRWRFLSHRNSFSSTKSQD